MSKSLNTPEITGLLLSGGLDSCILLHHLLSQGRQVQPFYIRTGVLWDRSEFAAARQFAEAVATPNLRSLVVLEVPLHDVYAGHWSLTGQNVPDAKSSDEAVFLPGRNSLLLVKAAVWCQLHRIRELGLATLGTSPFADATSDFITRFQEAINFGAVFPLRIVLPFAGFTKRQVMELGRNLPLKLTLSCIAPWDGHHCGACNKCEERRHAFAQAKILDPTHYCTEGN